MRSKKWLEDLLKSFSYRVLPIDQKVAQNRVRLNPKDRFPAVDSLLVVCNSDIGIDLGLW
jgi:hypothetical protein